MLYFLNREDFLLRENRQLDLDLKTSTFFTKINMSSEDVFELIEYSDNFIDLYPSYNDEYTNEYEDDYYFESKEQAYTKVNTVLSFFENFKSTIEIFRTILVKSEVDIDFSDLGESWSYEEQSAIDFAKNHGRGNILLKAKTNFDNIDWKKTVELNFIFSEGYDQYDENELCVIDSDKIYDVEVIKIK